MPPSAHKGKDRALATSAEVAAAGSLDADSDFAPTPSLAAFDSSLRCGICCEVYTAPVMISVCGHTFDSRCIHEHFNVKRDCPACHREAFVDHLLRNLVLDTLVDAWRAARPDLLALQSRAQAPNGTTGPISLSPGTSSPTARSKGSAARDGPTSTSAGTKRKTRTSSSSPARRVKRERAEDASSDIEILEDVPVAYASAKKPRPSAQAAQSPQRPADLTDPSVVVECPLCGRSLKNGSMSVHLDRCNGIAASSRSDAAEPSQAWSKLLSASTNGSRAASSRSAKDRPGSPTPALKLDTTKKLPLGSYQHRKAGQLAEMLQRYNLPTTVPPSCLTSEAKIAVYQRRHRQFVTIWNSNADLDASHPAHKTEKQMRQELSKWEKDQDKEHGRAEIGERHEVKYAEQFRELTAQARASAMAARRRQREPAAAEASEATDSAPAVPDEHEEADVAPTTSRTAMPDLQKKVRLLSPKRSSPPAVPSPEPAEAAGAGEDVLMAPEASSPPPTSSPLFTAHEVSAPDEDAEDMLPQSSEETLRRRSPSPFDPAGPRPSQRNRDEERMFARLHGGVLAHEPVQEQEEEEEEGPLPEEIGRVERENAGGGTA